MKAYILLTEYAIQTIYDLLKHVAYKIRAWEKTIHAVLQRHKHDHNTTVLRAIYNNILTF